MVVFWFCSYSDVHFTCVIFFKLLSETLSVFDFFPGDVCCLKKTGRSLLDEIPTGNEPRFSFRLPALCQL